MLKRHCMFQPLNRCAVGRRYAPEFYNFIEDIDTRSRWQRIAQVKNHWFDKIAQEASSIIND
jgi:hypothetical protein